MKKIGVFNCTYKRNGLIEIDWHPDFTIIDRITIVKFFTNLAKRNHLKRPRRVEIVL
jgi:hypothetical protein